MCNGGKFASFFGGFMELRIGIGEFCTNLLIALNVGTIDFDSQFVWLV